jgi:hypothetical protein
MTTDEIIAAEKAEGHQVFLVTVRTKAPVDQAEAFLSGVLSMGALNYSPRSEQERELHKTRHPDIGSTSINIITLDS